MKKILSITALSLVLALANGVVFACDDCDCKKNQECKCEKVCDSKCDCGCKEGKDCDCKKGEKDLKNSEPEKALDRAKKLLSYEPEPQEKKESKSNNIIPKRENPDQKNAERIK